MTDIRLILLFSLIISTLFISSCGGGGSNDDSDPVETRFSELNSDIFTGDTYNDSEVSLDANGDEIVRTKLAILFNPSATKAEVDALLTRINATITASVAGARSVSIRIPDPGTVDNLEIIIANIESESFVDAVLKSVVVEPAVVPVDVDGSTTDFKYIENHAAVGGAAAWNAKEAVSMAPNVIIMDWFGAGALPLTTFLDSDIFGTIHTGAPLVSDHGYHVAGIIAGSFGGSNIPGGYVTGMYPDHSNIHIIDKSNRLDYWDSILQVAYLAKNIKGTIILNTSLGKKCHISTTSATCREKETAMNEGIVWADIIRATGLESRLFHAKSAGNRRDPAPDMRDTQTNHAFSTAATMADMVTADGTPVLMLTNTMVVERLDRTGSPSEVRCLNDNSFIGGHISAIGTDVISLDKNGTTASYSGTSMASPQVAGLAAYMLSINPNLTPQSIKSILLDTAQPVPTDGGIGCSDWPTPAPAIDAYAAVLALDDASALSGNRNAAPVRIAILDVADSNGETGTNGQFDENDLIYFSTAIDNGTIEIENGTETVTYGRTDLNGDGFVGGRYKTKKLNLDINDPPAYSTVTQTIEGKVIEFDENALTDNEILCYYAYSSLYIGSSTERDLIMYDHCINFPTNVQVIPGDGSVTINWSTVPGAIGYNIYWASESGVTKLNWSSLQDGNSISTPASINQATISGLTNDTTYYFVVTAVNAAGESSESAEVNATPSSAVVLPAAPSNIQASPGDGSVFISWSSVSGATSYNLYWASASGVTKLNYSSLPNGDTSINVTSPQTISGLSNDTTYYFVVTAVNAAGESSESAEVNATPSSVVVLPTAPSNVQALPGDGSVFISWSSVSGATSYNLYWASASGVTKLNYSSLPNGDTSINVTSPQTISGLSNGTTYYLVVTAVNAAGESSESAEVNATPSSAVVLPAAPSNVQASPGDGSVSISWSAVSGATSYNLYWASASGVTKLNYSNLLNGDTSINVTSPQTITGLTNDTTYYFVVTAVNAAGESAESLEVNVTPSLVQTVDGLNDTGIIFGGNYPSGNNITCIGETIAEQDCSHGRDAQALSGNLSKIGDGLAGFDFTKLDSNGNALQASALNWSCVQDNYTGLVWEVKTTDGGIHDKDNTYRWGGITSLLNSEYGTVYDDWDTLVNGTNMESLCGFNDWRVPSREELMSIINYGISGPAVDTNYFPNTEALNNYWSATPSWVIYNAWYINTYSGYAFSNVRNYGLYVKLVRGGR